MFCCRHRNSEGAILPPIDFDLTVGSNRGVRKGTDALGITVNAVVSNVVERAAAAEEPKTARDSAVTAASHEKRIGSVL